MGRQVSATAVAPEPTVNLQAVGHGSNLRQTPQPDMITGQNMTSFSFFPGANDGGYLQRLGLASSELPHPGELFAGLMDHAPATPPSTAAKVWWRAGYGHLLRCLLHVPSCT